MTTVRNITCDRGSVSAAPYTGMRKHDPQKHPRDFPHRQLLFVADARMKQSRRAFCAHRCKNLPVLDFPITLLRNRTGRLHRATPYLFLSGQSFLLSDRLFLIFSDRPLDKTANRCYNTQAVAVQCISIWGYSSAGRALEWHSRGQRFDPAYLHQKVSEGTLRKVPKSYGFGTFSLFYLSNSSVFYVFDFAIRNSINPLFNS